MISTGWLDKLRENDIRLKKWEELTESAVAYLRATRSGMAMAGF